MRSSEITSLLSLEASKIPHHIAKNIEFHKAGNPWPHVVRRKWFNPDPNLPEEERLEGLQHTALETAVFEIDDIKSQVGKDRISGYLRDAYRNVAWLYDERYRSAAKGFDPLPHPSATKADLRIAPSFKYASEGYVIDEFAYHYLNEHDTEEIPHFDQDQLGVIRVNPRIENCQWADIFYLDRGAIIEEIPRPIGPPSVDVDNYYGEWSFRHPETLSEPVPDGMTDEMEISQWYEDHSVTDYERGLFRGVFTNKITLDKSRGHRMRVRLK